MRKDNGQFEYMSVQLLFKGVLRESLLLLEFPPIAFTFYTCSRVFDSSHEGLDLIDYMKYT